MSARRPGSSGMTASLIQTVSVSGGATGVGVADKVGADVVGAAVGSATGVLAGVSAASGVASSGVETSRQPPSAVARQTAQTTFRQQFQVVRADGLFTRASQVCGRFPCLSL